MVKKYIFRRLFFIILIITSILLLNFRFYLYNTNFYDKEFTKLNIYDKFPRETVWENTNNLFEFFKSGKELNDFFNEREKLHLIDVKNLINYAIFLLYASLILLIITFYLNRNSLSRPLIISGIALILIIIIFYLLNFQSMFFLFHKLAFTNNYWLLNPETDNLIKLFPQDFFKDFLIRIGINSFIIGIFLIAFGFFMAKRKNSLKIFLIKS